MVAICVTASHKPVDDTGMTLVKADAAHLAPETEFAAIRATAEAGRFEKASI